MDKRYVFNVTSTTTERRIAVAHDREEAEATIRRGLPGDTKLDLQYVVPLPGGVIDGVLLYNSPLDSYLVVPREGSQEYAGSGWERMANVSMPANDCKMYTYHRLYTNEYRVIMAANKNEADVRASRWGLEWEPYTVAPTTVSITVPMPEEQRLYTYRDNESAYVTVMAPSRQEANKMVASLHGSWQFCVVNKSTALISTPTKEQECCLYYWKGLTVATSSREDARHAFQEYENRTNTICPRKVHEVDIVSNQNRVMPTSTDMRTYRLGRLVVSASSLDRAAELFQRYQDASDRAAGRPISPIHRQFLEELPSEQVEFIS